MRRSDLELLGLTGWVPLLEVLGSTNLPSFPGIYAVSYDAGQPLSWPNKSVGGWHKGRDPAVSQSQLDANWVDGADIVYIGKTDRILAKRIREFARFGRGEAVAHWGGRLVWQLPHPNRAMIGWLSLEPGQAIGLERRLLREFFDEHGRLPFANLRR